MQRTENVTSPKQVYRGPYYQRPTGENHHYTHNPGNRLATGRVVGHPEAMICSLITSRLPVICSGN
jgi:hypothetical protein